MRLILCLVVFLICSASQAKSLFTFSNTPGPHGVGVRYVKQVDRTRTFTPKQGALASVFAKEDKRGRPLQTVIWYPAEKGGQPVRFDDYLQLVGWETDPDASPKEQARTVDAWLRMVTEGKRDAQVAAERRRGMWAVRDAVRKAGKFPVVIYAPSYNNTTFENADIAEYLASHGYIVISAPTVGLSSRWIKKDLMHAELQAADIRFLIDYARTLPQADMEQVAVAGFSWGGLANVLAASKDERIKALVCIDGAVRYYNRLMTQASYARPDKLRTPLLFLAQTPASMESTIRYKEDLSGSFISGMVNADVYLLTMYPMEHHHFGSAYVRLDDPAEYKEYTADEVSFAYTLGARYILNFLDGYLKNDAAARAYLARRPVANGAPPHALKMDIMPAKGTPR
ncbi:alpha/beta fold hydrolase [Massilia sp. MS-15]|uniref:alpha/beta fold hydrolase n=1 Tax=Massilia sp. MS-15 TaxID=2878200 RepID=UPI001CD399C0|nr:alpha/beta fold hydrolase [Massilia sp. MS-15]MCA1245194.1 dienelactone hydrolase family protein [Massilia sp. MS-15]